MSRIHAAAVAAAVLLGSAMITERRSAATRNDAAVVHPAAAVFLAAVLLMEKWSHWQRKTERMTGKQDHSAQTPTETDVVGRSISGRGRIQRTIWSTEATSNGRERERVRRAQGRQAAAVAVG